MQQSRREEVARYILFRKHTVRNIAEACQVSLKSVYNVRAKLRNGESLNPKKGAGRKWKLDSSNRISLEKKLKNHPRISLRALKSQFKVEKGIDISHESIRKTAKKIGYSKKTAIRGPWISQANEI